jgi:hypothetical protein
MAELTDESSSREASRKGGGSKPPCFCGDEGESSTGYLRVGKKWFHLHLREKLNLLDLDCFLYYLLLDIGLCFYSEDTHSAFRYAFIRAARAPTATVLLRHCWDGVSD